MKNTRIWVLGGIALALLIYLLRRPSASAPRSGGGGSGGGQPNWLNNLFGGGAKRTAAGANANNTAALITAGTGAFGALTKSLSDLWPTPSKPTDAATMQSLVNSGIGYVDGGGNFVFYDDAPADNGGSSYKPFYGSEGGDWSMSPTPDFVGTPQNTVGVFAPADTDYSGGGEDYYPIDGASMDWGWT